LLGDRDAGGERRDEGDDRAAGHRPGAGGGLPGGARGLHPAPRRDRGAEGLPQRGRHARPREVPARAGRPLAGRRPRGQPAGRRGAGDAARVVAQGPVRDAGGYGRRGAGGRPVSRVAAIDCGTNSIRLLVADAHPGTGELTDLDRRMTIVRLGEGVDRTGRLAPQALERTFAACRAYAEIIERHGAERTRFVATSASRDAENRDDFVRGVVDILGVEPEVITGDQEAAFSFTGATKELTGRTDLRRPFLVVDIGGGSTEFVLGDDRVRAARSVDVGCVRMTERHLVRDGAVTDPPTAGQVAAMRADIESALDLAEKTVPLREAHTLVGLAGSVTTVSAIA